MEDLLVFIGVPVLILAAVLGGADFMSSRSCSIYQEETGTQTKWRHLDECYIKTPGGWMPWSEFKARAITKEASK